MAQASLGGCGRRPAVSFELFLHIDAAQDVLLLETQHFTNRMIAETDYFSRTCVPMLGSGVTQNVAPVRNTRTKVTASVFSSIALFVMYCVCTRVLSVLKGAFTSADGFKHVTHATVIQLIQLPY